jgi:hypothetical protein
LPKYLWVEGIDFSDFIDDTSQLSIIRGSSLALSELGNHIDGVGKPLFSGASSALFLSDEVGTLNTQGAGRALKRMRLVHGFGDHEDEARAIRIAAARARFAQVTGKFPREEVEKSASMCALTRRLAGSQIVKDLTKDQINRLNLGLDAEKPTISSSLSAQDRREYGKLARSKFLQSRSEFDDLHGLEFTSDLHELAQPSRSMGALPLSVSGRMALFYADGNDFSSIRRTLGGSAADLANFSKDVNNIVIGRALKSIINHLKKGAEDESLGTTVHKAKEAAQQHRLRFELLVCGGDEFCFIAPAWLGLELAQIFFSSVADANHCGHALTFKAGLVFANSKSPIKPLRRAAEALADRAKIGEQNTIAIHAFESVQPTEQGFMTIREAIFENASPDPARLTAKALDKFLETLNDLKTANLPRSQIQKTIRAAKGLTQRDNYEVSKEAFVQGTPNSLGTKEAHEAAENWVNTIEAPTKSFLMTPSKRRTALTCWRGRLPICGTMFSHFLTLKRMLMHEDLASLETDSKGEITVSLRSLGTGAGWV